MNKKRIEEILNIFQKEDIILYDKYKKIFDNIENQSKFKVGKWYKSPKWNEFWIKCSNFDGKTIFVNERISGKKLITTKDQFTWLIETYVELTDLNEIQEFLPDGHIDKIKKQMTKEEILEKAIRDYPVGTVFKCPNGNCEIFSTKEYDKETDTWIITENKKHNIIVLHDERICVHFGNGYVYFNGKWAEIISKPEIKVEEEWIPKVGDWVTVLKKGDEGFQNFNSDFHKGNKTFKVGYVSNTSKWKRGEFVTETFKDEGNGVFYGRIRKALPHEIPTKQIGSSPSLVGKYLKYIYHKIGYGGVKPNHFYKIVEESELCLVVEIYGLTTNPIDTNYWELMPIDFNPKSNSLELPYQLNQVFETENNSNQPIYLQYQELKPMNYKQGQISQPILKEKINLQVIKIN